MLFTTCRQQSSAQRMQRTRSRTHATLPSNPNEEIAHALHSIHDLLAQLELVWHDHGRHPDCSFIHATKKTVPGLEVIMKVRRACKNWLFAHPPPLVESASSWQDRVRAFGFNNERKKGDEHTFRGLAGAFATRINVITVTTSGHRIDHYNPPENMPHSEDIWLIYLDLEHTRHYLSTTKILNTAPRIPPSTTRGANGNTVRIRRVTGSTIKDPTLVLVHGSLIQFLLRKPRAYHRVPCKEETRVKEIYCHTICMCFIANQKILGFYISVVHSFQAKSPKRGVGLCDTKLSPHNFVCMWYVCGMYVSGM